MRHCTCCDQMLPEVSFPRAKGDCKECCYKQLMIEIKEHPKSDYHLWRFRGWSTNVFDTRTMLEEDSEFLHVEVLQKNLKIDIAIKKKENSDDEYKVWVGDKQFVVKATKANKDTDDCGKLISTHKATDMIE